MPESFEIAADLPAAPDEIFRAWLDGSLVAEFTGSPASGDDSPGSPFTAWDGYISGTTLEIDPPRRIVQSWRTTEFPDNAPDSIVEIHLEKTQGGTLLQLKHSGIPDGQGEDYRQGWVDYYFNPLKDFFQ